MSAMNQPGCPISGGNVHFPFSAVNR